MVDTLERPNSAPTPAPSDDKEGASFTLDGRYLRDQASEAVALFLTPLSGVFKAATGRARLRIRRNRRRKHVA